MNKKFGKPISQLRKQWKREGRCPRCGGTLEAGFGACVKCRSKHAVRRARNRSETKPVLINMPRDLLAQIEADAKDRGESVEQWIVAESRAAFDEADEADD